MRETGNRMKRIARAVVTVSVVAVLSAMLSGCSLFADDVEQRSVAEYGGTYHFMVPGDWQAVVDAAVVAVYASEEPPSDENALDTLSIIIIKSPSSDEREPDELIRAVVGDRSEMRSWQDAEIGETAEAEVGGRPATSLEVTAKTADGTPFAARYTLVRTSGNDLLISATMPADQYDEFAPELDAIAENWFWHTPETNIGIGAEVATQTPAAAE